MNIKPVAFTTATAVGLVAFACAAWRATRSASSALRRCIRSRLPLPSSSARPAARRRSSSSTGTGGGFKLFCAGVGPDHPDVSNASRAIKKGEFEDCQKNGVKEIVEIKVGIDGLVIANAKGGPALTLTQEQVFRALAKEVPGHRRQARRQHGQDLEGRRRVASRREDRGSRPPAHLGHARLVPRARAWRRAPRRSPSSRP